MPVLVLGTETFTSSSALEEKCFLWLLNPVFPLFQLTPEVLTTSFQTELQCHFLQEDFYDLQAGPGHLFTLSLSSAFPTRQRAQGMCLIPQHYNLSPEPDTQSRH